MNRLFLKVNIKGTEVTSSNKLPDLKSALSIIFFD